MTDGPPHMPDSPTAHGAGAVGPPRKTRKPEQAESQPAHGTYPHDADPAQPSAMLTMPREGTPEPIETAETLRA
ncbi:MAG: hypothetical protein GEU94_18205, partial [Micromonosporaceae bacterium]|nr:hypothetical protein [Micromonosporaceae bacterium]